MRRGACRSSSSHADADQRKLPWGSMHGPLPAPRAPALHALRMRELRHPDDGDDGDGGGDGSAGEAKLSR